MTDHELEKLMSRLDGPEPSPQTGLALMAVARVTAKNHAADTARRKQSRRRFRTFGIGIAASLIIAFAAWLLFRPAPPRIPYGAVVSESIAIERNGREMILAQDAQLYANDLVKPVRRSDVLLHENSSVRIGAGSQLRLIPQEQGERVRLGLQAGRLFVRAARSPQKFIVTTPQGSVTVVGTAFGVTLRNSETTVSVIEGTVAVASDNKTIRVTRGQTASVAAGEAPRLIAANPNDELQWARDAKYFENRPLSEVLSWISRNSSYRFDVSPDAANVPVSAMIGNEPILQTIQAIGITCGLTVTEHGNDITIKK